jgi:hypothetical protein
MEFINEYAEYIVGIPSLLIATVLSIWIHRKENKKKKLNYFIIANEEILTYSDEIKDNVKIKYEGKTIKKLFIIIIRVWNKGGIPIKKDDFEGNIVVDLENNKKPISYEIATKNPKNLNTILEKKGNFIELKPCLLNPGDYFHIKIISDKKVENPKIIGRITGLKEIKEFQINSRIYRQNLVITGFIFFFYIIILAALFYKFALPSFMAFMFNTKPNDSFFQPEKIFIIFIFTALFMVLIIISFRFYDLMNRIRKEANS